MRQEHNYLGCNFETINLGNTLCAVLLNNTAVTGTTSQSRGEAAMRFMIMLDNMQDFESKPMTPGDAIEFNGQVGLINRLGVLRYPESVTLSEVQEGEPDATPHIEIRLGLGDGETNFRGPASAYVEDQTCVVALTGEVTHIPQGPVEWMGVAEIEFSACESVAVGEKFRYTKEVNVWKLM